MFDIPSHVTDGLALGLVFWFTVWGMTLLPRWWFRRQGLSE